MRWILLGLLVLVAACGGEDGNPLRAAADRLGELDATRLSMELEASSGEAEVGFAVDGELDLPDGEGGGLPVADLRTASRSGRDVLERRLLVTGDAGYVVVDGEATELEGAALESLRVPESGDGPVALHLEDWIVDAETTTSGDRTRVTGAANVEVVLRDLAAVAQGFAATELPELGTGAAGSVRSSTVVAELDGDDDLRMLEAVIELAAPDAPEQLGVVTIRFRLELAPLDAPLRVAAP